MDKTRKSYRLPDDVIRIVETVQKEKSFATETESITYIIKEYARQSRSGITDNDKNEIADITAGIITDKLKNQMDRIRLASTFSERYSYMVLDAINTLLYEHDNLFLMPANGETKHSVVEQSESNYKAMIERNKQIKDNDVGKKEKR